MRRSWVAVLVLGVAACTGPVRSYGVYESKAGRTAETVVGAVETARLAVDAGGGKAYGRYLAQVLAEAEEDAGAAQGVFDAIQPPDRRADRLRDRLDQLSTEAVSTLAELRIAARRGRTAELPELAAPLGKVAEQLHAFAEAHA